MSRFTKLALAACILAAVTKVHAEEIAFPGAEGFGAMATGGRGGEIVHVTNTNDAGPGSLRDAVSAEKRIVVFDVGGVIKLKSPLSISSNITLAGQSAPGEGVSVYGSSVSLSGSKNVIVRHMRFREGIAGPRGKCSLNMNHVSNIIVDHCSIEWGRWDCLGVTESTTVTIQNCIIGEGVDPQRFGCLCETDDITFSHNLWINNQSRNPKAKGTVQYINNVVYNWGVTGLVGGHSGADHWLDMLNNVFIKGPNSNDRFVGQFASTDYVFQSGNLFDGDKDGKLNPREAVVEDFRKGEDAATSFGKAIFAPKIAVTTDPALVAYEKVIAGAGASLHRDAIDSRLIDSVKSLGTAGKIIKEESESGGHPELKSGEAPKDADHDGIPDAWETNHKMNPNDPADANARIEEYLNSIAPK